ncbi:hypothetical protein HYPSUDRAFT_200932 [Hypholoma sublateritium FD-334 SS-4]|uniref:Uncharacterized protein n=1 Tax=Hypholoma sublateritium (strain FD-334 SS-4) TaxID=945553 RepID=A0A0D2NZP4_HYPSF|nr:hypothetical protein HYPSUDRAFT_200932 [Hypholoma sublateritium FD-334 SS-4]
MATDTRWSEIKPLNFASSATSLLSGATSPTLASSNGAASPSPPTLSGPSTPTPASAALDKDKFGAANSAYLLPPPDPSLTKVKRSDKRTLAALAKKFEDGLRDDELSREFKDVHVFLLLDLLKNKSQNEAAAYF